MSQIESNPIQTRKMMFIRNGKICILLEGLLHGFGRKFEIFFIFAQNKNKNTVAMYRQKATQYRPDNDLFTKSKNWHSSKGVSPRVWSKNSKCFIFFIFVQNRNKNSLVMFQIQSNHIQTRKMTFLLNRKIGILLKGLVHGFSRKILNVLSFYCCSKQKQKQFGNVLDTKQPYRDQKNDLFTKSKN